MRVRLLTAVRALLADARLLNQKDVVRVGALVLLAKASFGSCRVELTARELARWLGVSESTIDHEVLRVLREIEAVATRVVRGVDGLPKGLEYRVELLWEARANTGAPLALSRSELATLLRCLESLFAPGWGEKCATPPGLLAARRGRGAASDRLAMVLLVLHARPDGRVPLVGGPLPKKVARLGRAAVTLARILGCGVPAASTVLQRLQATGAVAGGSDQLRVQPVAAANNRAVPVAESVSTAVCEQDTAASQDNAVPCPQCSEHTKADDMPLRGEGWEQLTLENTNTGGTESPPQTALRGQQIVDSAVFAAQDGFETADVDPDGADFHAHHAVVVDVGGEGAGDCGFSGSAVGGEGDLPECVRAREGAVGSSTASAGVGPGGPLRGEKPDRLWSEGDKASGARWVFRGRASVPTDLGEALAPVAWLWASVGRSSTRKWLAGAVRGEVGRLRGLVAPELAQRVLGERLERRLRDQRQPVKDVVAWLLKVGLPQRAGCWSMLCDEGIRLDTRGACESCQVLIGDRRGLRRAVADRVLEDRLSGRLVVPQSEVGREVERRLQEAVREELVRRAAARERAVAEQAVREASYEVKRQRFAEEEWARAAAPCADCGVPEACGLCLGCTERRGIEAAVEDAVAFALVLRFDPADAPGARALWQDCERATRAALEERLVQLREQGVDEAALSWNGCRLMEELRDRRRRAVIVRLGQHEEAEQAARMAASALRRKQHQPNTPEAQEAVREAGEGARRRVAERWLDELLAELRAVCSLGWPEVANPTDWARVLPELAVRELCEDAADRVRERVSAA